jgi:hypothetical protein
MQQQLRWFLGLLTSLTLCGPGMCNDGKNVDGQKRLNSVVEKLRARTITSVHILWMDPTAESRATITPEMLEKIYFRKLAIRDFAKDRLQEGLTEAVQKTSFTEVDPNVEGDVRWAIKFYQHGQRAPVDSIYLDGTCQSGVIAGTPYSFHGPLCDWLNTNFFTVSSARRRR